MMPSMSLSLMRMMTLSAPLQRMMVMIMMMVVFVLVTPLPSPCGRLRRENVNMSNPHLADHNNTSSAEGFTEIAAWNNTVKNMGTHMGNSTEHAMGNSTPMLLIHGATGARCFLATCGTANLVDRLQGGEEKAGDATADPFGPGKK
ncbi:uncharacterized protein zgc:193726 isoform X1 [Simochromis diagramma]|uniref:uncharacterized protein zgc:193726 isoform X1 n=1 Tax=Simochromis diagramma TaxID=43689 RepID=UPI001A7EECE8|nr:uncharacterized protein zgc:193726 isoform X1 [Simochromis diagramma]